ncbi:secreted protein [Rhodopirellula sallentina SM41]|uniref:Secreted protein n=1 Tax=Rhodopirellula sallentina SM41 TaxID=1263870 RepID=M5U751_9BACT|nr:secreted protein [Rhodopirellula sallentina SM41]
MLNVLKSWLLVLPLFIVGACVVGCGGSQPSVVETDELSAEEAEALRIANEEYEAYMNE